MIINHNLGSMNAHRQMGINQGSNVKSMEKLSSGMRINRAGDDAAGLSISEKMRAQVNGLNQASRNSQDGISLIQTAEGALDESHSILQRMRELAVQASNDTNDDQDRTAIKDELGALTEELTRISTDTEFNGRTLLDDSETVTLQVGANAGQHIDINLKGMSATDLIGTGTLASAGAGTVIVGKKVDEEFLDAIGAKTGSKLSDGYYADEISAALVAKIVSYENHSLMGIGVEEVSFGAISTGGKLSGDQIAILKFEMGSAFTAGYELDKLDGALVNKIKSYNAQTLTISKAGGVDVSNLDKANSAIDTLDSAIKKVSEFRSELGAVQNRLEHTIKNLDNAAENTQAAESRIRDVDMAEEMMEFTRTNVLSQASQSMLAQANQKPNQVLQLLG